MRPKNRRSSQPEDHQSPTLATLARSKQQYDELPTESDSDEGESTLLTEDLQKRQKKTYSMSLGSVLAIERMRVEVLRQGENVSASDLVNEAVMLLLKNKGLTL